MSKKINGSFVPKLRFPEFRDSSAWVEKSLNEVSPSVFDGTHQTPTYTEAGIPFFSVENIISGNKNKFISKEDHVAATLKNKPEKGDIIITRIGNIGTSKVVDWDYEFSIYVTLAIVKKSDLFNSHFLNSYFQSPIYQKEILSKSLLNAVPCKINMDELRKTKVLLPPDKEKKEQQKIADCLSSLDELITTENQKLEAFQLHKKGLMQQLFPAEGEKVPKLRFKEFKDSGAWEEKTIGEIALVTTGGTPDSTNEKYWNGDIPWMNSGELNQKKVYEVSNRITALGLKESSTKLIPPSCVLIGLAGQGKTRGTAAINYIELCTNQSIASIHPNKSIFISEFLYYKIDSIYDELRKISAGDGGRGGLNLQIIKSIKVAMPKLNEQKIIADCLSSLDDLINEQDKKVEGLKAHKKGLMQQLFPDVNATE